MNKGVKNGYNLSLSGFGVKGGEPKKYSRKERNKINKKSGLLG
jgi:hypothetical protein